MMKLLVFIVSFSFLVVSCLPATWPHDRQPGPCHVDRSVDFGITLLIAPREQELLNQLTEQGLDRVNDVSLQYAALEQAEYEASQDAFSHIDGIGRHSWERVTACGYAWVNTLEEIPYGGTGQASEVIAALQASPEWPSFIDSQWTDIGVAAVQSQTGTWYWVIVEARQ